MQNKWYTYILLIYILWVLSWQILDAYLVFVKKKEFIKGCYIQCASHTSSFNKTSLEKAETDHWAICFVRSTMPGSGNPWFQSGVSLRPTWRSGIEPRTICNGEQLLYPWAYSTHPPFYVQGNQVILHILRKDLLQMSRSYTAERHSSQTQQMAKFLPTDLHPLNEMEVTQQNFIRLAHKDEPKPQRIVFN